MHVMRVALVALASGLTLLPVAAAAADPPAADNKLGVVEIIAPSTPLAISLAGGRGEIEVFYLLKSKPPAPLEKVRVTSAGPLRGAQLRIADEATIGTAVRSFRVVVKATTPLKVGDSFRGALIFQSGGKVDSFDFTVTETAAATYALDPGRYDVCVGCGDPPVFAVRVSNTGVTRITRLKVSSLTLEDASNHHRVVSPPPASRTQGARPADRATARADVVEMQPGDEKAVDIAPGGSLTIHLRLTVPPRAGDYAGTAQIAANDGEPKPVQLTLRTRGPQMPWLCPLVLFVFAVVLGALAARVLEHYYGSGGGLVRARALLSLDASRAMLGDLARWLRELPAQQQAVLSKARVELDGDLAAVDDVLRSVDDRKATELATLAEDIAGRVAKRRTLRSAVGLAQGSAEVIARLDEVLTNTDVNAYREALNKELLSGAKREGHADVAPLEGSGVPTGTRSAKAVLRWIPPVRHLVWMAVVVGTAYTMFYANRCSFGTLVDYITVFFWGLGLTQAGFAVLGEGRSSYTPPAPAESNA